MNIQDEEELLSCPGDTLKEWLEEKKMAESELSRRMRGSYIFLNGILDGSQPITENIAWDLEEVTHIPAQFWINRERRYRIKKAWIERAKKRQDGSK